MIYFLEDDASIRKLVIYTLHSQGMEAQGFDVPSAFWSAMETAVPDLLLLDLMLPEEDGLSILQKLRNASATANLPVIIITAKDSEFDKVTGLDAGADDYISKPFGMMELLSRIRAVTRRYEKTNDPSPIEIAGVSVCPTTRKITVDGADINLTLKEFELLYTLMAGKGRVFTRDHLLSALWGYDFDGTTRTVDVHIRSLRRKLGKKAYLIKTVRGVGYKFGELPL